MMMMVVIAVIVIGIVVIRIIVTVWRIVIIPWIIPAIAAPSWIIWPVWVISPITPSPAYNESKCEWRIIISIVTVVWITIIVIVDYRCSIINFCRVILSVIIWISFSVITWISRFFIISIIICWSSCLFIIRIGGRISCSNLCVASW